MFKSVFSRMFWNTVIIVFTALLAMISTVTFIFSNYVNDRQYEVDMKAAENIQFMTIYLEIKNPDYRNYYVYTNFLEQYAEFTESDITVVNANGEVHAATNSIVRVPQDMNKKVLSGNIIRTNSTFGDAYSKKVFVVGVPITFNGNVVGGIYFNTQIPNLRGQLKEYYLLMLFPVLISMFIGCIMSYIKSKKITSPLKDINKAVLELASGDFTKRITVSSDEIGQLASSFNYMADSLERLDGLRSRFVSDVSHELRTPMTSISGFVGGILDGTIPVEKEKDYLQIVYDESIRLTKLTNDMLEMTKMQSAEYKLDISEFDINELIRICIIQLEHKIESKNLELEVEFEPDKINVLADKDAIKRVIINIIENAVKFSYDKTKIIIKTGVANKVVNVSIGNFGAGISSDEMKNVFDRFYKTDKSRSDDKKGAGLGLSLAKNIMNLHRQKIWVESFDAKEGSNVKFTRFTFTLKQS